MKTYLRTFNILTDSEIEAVLSVAKQKTVSKSEYLISAGEVSQKVAFVKSGIFRTFYRSNTGEEMTYCITFPNNLTTAYSSYISGQKTRENIQAITPAEVLLLPKNELEKLAKTSYNWLSVLKTIAEQQYIELEKRLFQFQEEKAKQRYLDLLQNQPEYVQHIPLQYLASYLGITQRHLSRLRKEISY